MIKLIHLLKSDNETPELWKSDDAGGGLVKAVSMGTSFKSDLEDALSRFIEFSMDTGTATGGSNTTCVDTGKSWATDIWKGAVIEVHTAADSLAHYSVISGNTATTITFGALAGAVSVAAGDDYAIRLQTGIADIYKWGGTVLTGRDVSLDFKALTDDGIKGVLKSIGDITTSDNLIARLGALADAMVAAGATGSLSAKARRLTNDLDALITQMTADLGDATSPGAGSLNARMGEVQATPTANTLLARLKTIATDIGTLTTQLTADIGDATSPGAGSLNARVGEVQATPTANTLLARLKNLATLIGEVQASPTSNTLLDRLKQVEAGIDELKVLIGEVQASPTANTVLDRLKAIATAIGLLPQLATTPAIYNVTMTNLDAEYSQALPANTKKYSIQCRDGTSFRLAFVTGKVATPVEPYVTVGVDGFQSEDQINPASLTLYFACDDAAKVVEIIAWS